MAIELVDKGTNNTLDIDPWYETNGRLRIEFLGSNNNVRMTGRPRDCAGTLIQLGNHSSVAIGEGCGLSNSFIHGKDGCHVVIGDRCTFTTRVRFIMHESSRITLGRDCMIASDVQFMTSDNHTIFDPTTRKRLNRARDIEIADHVWISLQCFVTKGARIGTSAVIGLRSVVTGAIPANCVAAGAPARVVRQGVDWDRKLWAQDPDDDNPKLDD